MRLRCFDHATCAQLLLIILLWNPLRALAAPCDAADSQCSARLEATTPLGAVALLQVQRSHEENTHHSSTNSNKTRTNANELVQEMSLGQAEAASQVQKVFRPLTSDQEQEVLRLHDVQMVHMQEELEVQKSEMEQQKSEISEMHRLLEQQKSEMERQKSAISEAALLQRPVLNLKQGYRSAMRKREWHVHKDKQGVGVPPCACETSGTDWVRPAAREPRCVFIDLGAANGNTFDHFLNDGYGQVKNCPSGGAYDAILVEANPIFNAALKDTARNHPGSVRSLVSSAAYMCEGSTSFFLDTVDVRENFWGSSMSPNARDVQRSGQKPVTVPLVNVVRLIMESTLPEDYVLLKMDIEGSEHDIMPCLAKSEAAKLIDAVYVETHPVEWSLAGATEGALQDSISSLQASGVYVPDYNSPS